MPVLAERAALQLAEATYVSSQVQEGYIYVYDMPSEFTDDLTELPVQWHPSQYDYDQVFETYGSLLQGCTYRACEN